MSRSVASLVALAALGLVAASPPADPGVEFAGLLERIPTQSNLIMFFDFEALLDSPMAKREDWRGKMAANRPDPLGIAGGVKLGVAAQHIDVRNMNERWRIAMLKVAGKLPKLEELAAREGGYVEEVAGVPVVFTPRDIELLRFGNDVLGSVSSVDRQALVGWVESTLSKPRKYPPSFADKALFKVGSGHQITMGVDLRNMVSARAIEPWLNAMPEVKKSTSEPKLLAPRLASVESATLAVKVDQGIEGSLVIGFGKTLEGTGPILRAVVLQTAEDLGIDLPELKTWRIGLGSKNDTIEMEGRLSVDSLRKIASIGAPPRLSAAKLKTDAPKPADPKPAPGADGASPYSTAAIDTVATSQGYFRSVSAVIESLKKVDRPTYRATKTWYDRYAKQIEELPILGVDKDLLDWGSQVSRTLREMASGINYYANNQNYTLASQPNGVYYGYDYAYVNSKSYDQAVIKRQSDAMMSVDLDKRFQALELSSSDMRRKMVEKYQVDF
ncbi:MAG: hypothetical protein SFX72_18980 [Isosphaeraceae bacterium]|nr:hypothetical protein [Isosphaeraceae bacterium]